jgi:hypothetical protein
MASDPDCPVCKDETTTDLRMWRKHRTLVAAKTPDVGESNGIRLKAIAFDLDAVSLSSLQEALSEWEVEVVTGATAASLAHDWDPGVVNLFVVKAREEVAETLGLCCFLVACDRFATDSRAEVEASGRHANRQT